MLCRLNKTKWRVSGFKNGKFKSSWQKRPSCFSNMMASEVGAEDWKKFGGVMGGFCEIDWACKQMKSFSQVYVL